MIKMYEAIHELPLLFLLQRPMIKNCFGTTVEILVVQVALVICTNTNLGILLGPLAPSRSSLVCVQCVIMRLRFDLVLFAHLFCHVSSYVAMADDYTPAPSNEKGVHKTLAYVHVHCLRI